MIAYDIEKIKTALQDFYNATGIDMDLLKPDFSPVSEKVLQNNRYCRLVQDTRGGNAACRASDIELLKRCEKTRKVEQHICHAGLIDVAIPILYEDLILGYIVAGRMRTETDFSKIYAYLQSLGVSTTEAYKSYLEIPAFDTERIKSISSIATMLVKYILLENMLKPDADDLAQKAIDFIDENLENDLTVKTISKHLNVSKNVLYNKFHERLNCTVNQYVNKKRIEKSLAFLLKTDLSIEEISQKTGFSGASYYSKAFKKQMGVSPLKYKKEHKK